MLEACPGEEQIIMEEEELQVPPNQIYTVLQIKYKLQIKCLASLRIFIVSNLQIVILQFDTVTAQLASSWSCKSTNIP